MIDNRLGLIKGPRISYKIDDPNSKYHNNIMMAPHSHDSKAKMLTDKNKFEQSSNGSADIIKDHKFSTFNLKY